MMFQITFENPVVQQDMKEINSHLPESRQLYNNSIYISGASGMIASYLTAYLIWLNEEYHAGIQIYAGVRNRHKAQSRFGKYLDKDYFHLIEQDVSEPLSDSIHLDYIIHAASLASPQYYGKYPVETALPNIIGTYHLLEYSKRHTVKGFLFFSSGSVYGSVGDVSDISENTLGTMDYLAKGNTYGESKRCGEMLCRAYYNEYSVPITAARIHHTYGPTMDIEDDTRVFSEMVSNIVHNQNIVLKSSGEAKRAFCYITDTVTGLLKILISGEHGEVYNIGNPSQYIKIIELAKSLVDLYPERNLSIIRQERTDIGYSASPEKRDRSVNVDKLRDLGWESKITINDGFSRTIEAIET